MIAGEISPFRGCTWCLYIGSGEKMYGFSEGSLLRARCMIKNPFEKVYEQWMLGMCF